MRDSNHPYSSVAEGGMASPSALTPTSASTRQAPPPDLLSGPVPVLQQPTGTHENAWENNGGGGGGGGGLTGSGGGEAGGEAAHHVVHFDAVSMDNDSRRRLKAAEGDEESDEINSYAGSILSSVITADEISDKVGFTVVCLVILVGDMSRGVFFPTMWPLVQILGGDTVHLGYAVAAFSFGRILSSPIFGSWSVTHGYSNTLLTSVSILLVGTLMYAQVENVGKPEFLILAQTALGVGSGTLGVTRAFVADVTPNRNRTTYIALLTSVQYAGFTVTPFFGALFAKIYTNDDLEIHAGLFVLDEYTAPAYFMTIVCAITLVLLMTLFRDRNRSKGAVKKKTKKALAKDEVANARTLCGLLSVYDACILGCMLLNVSTKGSIASFETLGIAFAQTHFDLYASRAGTIVATCGTLGVLSLLSMGQIAKFLSDVQMIVGGMFFMIVGVLSITGLQASVINPTWRYVLGIFFIYSIGYPIGHTAVIGLFSKIVGRRPQGTLLGWFASAGSMARMAFPIMSGYIADFSDISTLFIILAVVLGLATAFTLAARSTLRTLSS